MSSGTHPQATAAPTISTLSFSQNPQHGQMEKKVANIMISSSISVFVYFP